MFLSFLRCSYFCCVCACERPLVVGRWPGFLFENAGGMCAEGAVWDIWVQVVKVDARAQNFERFRGELVLLLCGFSYCVARSTFREHHTQQPSVAALSFLVCWSMCVSTATALKLCCVTGISLPPLTPPPSSNDPQGFSQLGGIAIRIGAAPRLGSGKPEAERRSPHPEFPVPVPHCAGRGRRRTRRRPVRGRAFVYTGLRQLD